MDTPLARTAVALISGGLDSMLAAKLMLEQGVRVEGLNFFTGFCVEGHTHSIRSRSRAPRNNALWVAERLGIRLHFVDVVEEYKQVVLNPRHGYGANLNPCIDCKGFMVRRANEWRIARGYDFIVTGEVIGQRPKSQRRQALPIVVRESGAGDRLLRPLCAKHLEPTLPEREGWVDRERLCDFHGRSRKPQISMAARFGFEDYAQPAGGCCFLANRHYSAKLGDLWRGRGERDYDLDDIMLLKVGRHIRPRPHFKLIVGREEGENRYLRGYRKRFVHIDIISHLGPLTLIEGNPDDEDLLLSAKVAARFSQGRHADRVQVEIVDPAGASRTMEVEPLSSDDIPRDWYVG
ncbi:MAG: tRNA (5-methylaminomethyl-2-thiouridylate)-methyltransferase [Ectothiorhodospiraceae bacterium AqS1]|nr:tRNA (5-methylaminomethyl-2-thiouridylate)-methyltransferase [Ectothiorhodospiraceae bacterium AqS1]